MDARQRLNQLRRFKTKINRNKPQNKKRLTDLRQLISRNNNKTTQNSGNSVKTRIGFKTKNINQIKNRQMSGHNKYRIDNRKTNKKVLLTEERLPTVFVDLSKIESKPSTSSIESQLTYSPTNRQNKAKNSVLVSNLNKMITDSDIQELFGEIGPIVKSSKINSSVALIVYQNERDARNACQTYHNRLLDGLPMQCNTLSLSDDEYSIEEQPISEGTLTRQTSTLLASQFRQINSITPKQKRGQTLVNNKSNNRSNRSNVQFIVNV